MKPRISFIPKSESGVAPVAASKTPAPGSQAVGAADRATRVVRAGLESDPTHGAVMPPLYLSSNFTFEGLGEPRQFDYTRSGNPTRQLLVDALCDLEGAAGGAVTSSGMSAISVALHLVAPGGRIVAAHDCYGGTYRLLQALADRRQIEVEWVDLTLPGAVERASRRGAIDWVWIETPSNPLLRVTDLKGVIAEAQQRGARVVVDNTFLSPALQTPLAWGADLVVHSTTKYLNGHSDVVGGAILAREAELAEQVEWWSNCLGVTGAPFDSYLTLRGLRTLAARMPIHCHNAQSIAEFLEGQRGVGRVYYPGLPSHEGHEVAARQQSAFGGMLSFELEEEHLIPMFLRSLRYFSLAESLGGVESLIAHPATMTHAAMTAEARQRSGIGASLLRLSVGLENVTDLVNDLQRALAASFRGKAAAAAASQEASD